MRSHVPNEEGGVAGLCHEKGGFILKASNTFYQPLLRSTILLYSQAISLELS
jgi:hypothetical protein